MIVSFKDMLQNATDGKYAVGAFNIGNKDILDATIAAAEEKKIPAIVAVSVPEMNFLGDEFFSYVKLRLKKSEAQFCLHLDHGSSLEDIKRGINNGCTSVMIDASNKSFEENVNITKEVVDYAHSLNVYVEGELGTIGNTGNSSCGEGLDTSIIYTDPDKAKEFCELTGVDALAVAIGTSHGMYPKGKTPKLRIDILQKIRERTSTFLVLHGGSGNADEEVIESIRHGISKINISSEVKKAYFEELYKYLGEYPDSVKTQVVFQSPVKAAKDKIVEKMKMFMKN